MNFLITDNNNKVIQANEEVVIIELQPHIPVKKIYLHFAKNRFTEQENKIKEFIHHIDGHRNILDGSIETNKDNYQIYDDFYNIFY